MSSDFLRELIWLVIAKDWRKYLTDKWKKLNVKQSGSKDVFFFSSVAIWSFVGRRWNYVVIIFDGVSENIKFLQSSKYFSRSLSLFSRLIESIQKSTQCLLLMNKYTRLFIDFLDWVFRLTGCSLLEIQTWFQDKIAGEFNDSSKLREHIF